MKKNQDSYQEYQEMKNYSSFPKQLIGFESWHHGVTFKYISTVY